MRRCKPDCLHCLNGTCDLGLNWPCETDATICGEYEYCETVNPQCLTCANALIQHLDVESRRVIGCFFYHSIFEHNNCKNYYKKPWREHVDNI